MQFRRRLVVAIATVLLATGCNIGEGGRRSEAQRIEQPTTTTVAPTTLPPASAAPSCPALPERVAPDPRRPRYTIQVDIRPAEKTVKGTQQVRFTPDVETDQVVFRLWPNSPDLARAGAHIDVSAVNIAGIEVPSKLESPSRLTIPLAEKLPAGQEIEVGLSWSLIVPENTSDRLSVTGDAMRLGSFFPIMPWEPGIGWATDPATGGFAEDSTAPTADFDLTISAPPDLTVLASGVPDRPGHWTALEMRDVAISVGRFSVAEAVAAGPDPVKITVGVDSSVGDSAGSYLSKAKSVVEDFAYRYGPYPWSTLSIAITPHLDGGIEYPTHIIQGPGTFGSTTSHEVGHMWFYGLVGNNQGRDPWLDEGLATWAEAQFEGSIAPIRLTEPAPEVRARVGEPMTFWKDHRSDYYPGVYVQGAQALDALGPANLVDCALRVYVAQNAYRVARTSDLVAAVSAVFPDAKDTLARFGAKV